MLCLLAVVVGGAKKRKFGVRNWTHDSLAQVWTPAFSNGTITRRWSQRSAASNMNDWIADCLGLKGALGRLVVSAKRM